MNIFFLLHHGHGVRGPLSTCDKPITARHRLARRSLDSCCPPVFLVLLLSPTPTTSRPPTPRASTPPPCTNYQTSRHRPVTAGRKWLRPRPFPSRGPTTKCPSQLRSSVPRRRRHSLPSYLPAPRSICPSTCPFHPTSPDLTRTTSCGQARGRRRGGLTRKARQMLPRHTSCLSTPRMSTTCGTCVEK